MMDLQPVHETILELRQRLEEDDRLAVAVAVEEGEPTFGLAQQSRPKQRHDRSDPGSTGEADIMIGRFRFEIPGKAAVRRHDLDRIAGAQIIVGPVRKEAAGYPFHRHHHFIVLGRDAKGVIAPHFLAADICLQGQVLTRLEDEGLAKRLGHRKADGFGLGRLRDDFRDRKPVEADAHRRLSGI